jgi:Low-density lipoprotein receptor domain class A
MSRHNIPYVVATLAFILVAPLGACGPSGDDRSDATLPADCEAFQFDCGDGVQCVDSDQICDGTEDCNTGADEADCGCGVGWMTCDNGDCVHSAFICDGVFNCSDHSDEENCPGP